MTALLVIIIVLVVAQIVRYEWRSYTYKRDYQRGIEQNNKNNEKLLQYQQEVAKFYEQIKRLVEIISADSKTTANIMRIFQSKLDSLESKTPYKKRVRKLKEAGVEVQETKSANANGADVIIESNEPCVRTYYPIETMKNCAYVDDVKKGSIFCVEECEYNLSKGEHYDKKMNSYYVFCNAKANKEENKNEND